MGYNMGAGTLYDPYLYGIYDSNLNQVHGPVDGGGATGDGYYIFSDAKAMFMPQTSGFYYIEAGSVNEWNPTPPIGNQTYQVSVQEWNPGNPYNTTVSTPTTAAACAGNFTNCSVNSVYSPYGQPSQWVPNDGVFTPCAKNLGNKYDGVCGSDSSTGVLNFSIGNGDGISACAGDFGGSCIIAGKGLSACAGNYGDCGLKYTVFGACAGNVSACAANGKVMGFCGGNASHCTVAATVISGCGAKASLCQVNAKVASFCGAKATACGVNTGTFSLCGADASACGINVKGCGVLAGACGLNVPGDVLAGCAINIIPLAPSC